MQAIETQWISVMARSVKAVFFDLNNTLHEDSAERFFAAVQRTCEQFGDQTGIPPQHLIEAYLAGNREHYLQADMQRGTLRALGLGSYFPVVVISGELGAGKPSVEIFAEAARRAGVALQEAAHIGDSLVNDVAGAKGAGMVAIWLNRRQQRLQPDDPQPDHAVASLGEVLALLSA